MESMEHSASRWPPAARGQFSGRMDFRASVGHVLPKPVEWRSPRVTHARALPWWGFFWPTRSCSRKKKATKVSLLDSSHPHEQVSWDHKKKSRGTSAFQKGAEDRKKNGELSWFVNNVVTAEHLVLQLGSFFLDLQPALDQIVKIWQFVSRLSVRPLTDAEWAAVTGHGTNYSDFFSPRFRPATPH